MFEREESKKGKGSSMASESILNSTCYQNFRTSPTLPQGLICKGFSLGVKRQKREGEVLFYLKTVRFLWKPTVCVSLLGNKHSQLGHMRE